MEPNNNNKNKLNSSKNKLNSKKNWLYYIKGLFRYNLFCWNWKIITESTVDKDKN